MFLVSIKYYVLPMVVLLCFYVSGSTIVVFTPTSPQTPDATMSWETLLTIAMFWLQDNPKG